MLIIWIQMALMITAIGCAVKACCIDIQVSELQLKANKALNIPNVRHLKSININ